jgi:hypothetical protein
MSFSKNLVGLKNKPTVAPSQFSSGNAHAAWDQALSDLQQQHVEHRAERVRSSIKLLDDPVVHAENKVSILKGSIERLRQAKPDHPLIAEALAALNDYVENRFVIDSTPPTLLAIGSTECNCPYCMTPLEKFPARATKCKQCGKKYFSRKRPFDEQQVVLREDELPALEEEWKKDYQIKQMQPRQPDPVWQERIRVALETDSHENPEVENAARVAFQDSIKLILNGLAPRDATDHVLEKFSGKLKEQIEIRIWQLQVRSMHGKG